MTRDEFQAKWDALGVPDSWDHPDIVEWVQDAMAVAESEEEAVQAYIDAQSDEVLA